MDFAGMDFTTIGIGIIGLLLVFAFLKFLIKLPFYIMTIGILAALAYAAYAFLLPLLN